MLIQIVDGQLSVKQDGCDWCDYDPTMGASDDTLTNLLNALLKYELEH